MQAPLLLGQRDVPLGSLSKEGEIAACIPNTEKLLEIVLWWLPGNFSYVKPRILELGKNTTVWAKDNGNQNLRISVFIHPRISE